MGDEGFQDEHGGDIADEVRQHRRDRRQDRRCLEIELADRRDHFRRQHVRLQRRDDDEQASEHEEQRPIDLAIDLLRLDLAREQQQRAADDRHLGDGLTGEEKDHHRKRDENRLGNEHRMRAGGTRHDDGEPLATQKFPTINEREEQNREGEANRRHWPQGRGERPIRDVREAADDHVLRIASDRRDAADIGCQRYSQQIWDRIALQAANEIEHQRRHDQANGVVDEKGRERAGHDHNRQQQNNGMVGARHDPVVRQPKKAGKAQVGDDDHHAEQQRDRVEIDRAIGVIERDDAKSDHQARAEERRAGAVEPVARQLADGHDQIGRREYGDGDARSSVRPTYLFGKWTDVDAARGVNPQRDNRGD